jgi:hypothetical protein
MAHALAFTLRILDLNTSRAKEGFPPYARAHNPRARKAVNAVASLSCDNKSNVAAMNMFVGIWFKF